MACSWVMQRGCGLVFRRCLPVSRLRLQSRGCNQSHSGATWTAEIAHACSGIGVSRPGERGPSCVAQPGAVVFLLIKEERLLWIAPYFPFRGTVPGLRPFAGAIRNRGASTRPFSQDRNQRHALRFWKGVNDWRGRTRTRGGHHSARLFVVLF